MKRFIVHWLTVTVALAVAAHVVPGVYVSSLVTLAIAGLVLGFVNAAVRPILSLLALPITILTLGLFIVVINGAAFALAAWLVPGFRVDGFVAAVLGALVVSVVSWFVGFFTGSGRKPRKKKRK